MTDVSQEIDQQPGIDRATDGTIQDQGTPKVESTPTTTPSTETTPKPDAKTPTLLNQIKEPAKPEPAKEGDKPDPKAVPEKYEFKLPEGLELKPEVATEVDGLFRKLGLSGEAGQELMDFYISKTQSAAEAPYEAYVKTVEDWGKESSNHPDLRGKLGAGKEITVRIGRLLDSLPDQQLAADFREHMDLTGAGNHHAFIRIMDHFARALTEGTSVTGNGPAKVGQSEPGRPAPSAAAALYPHLPSANRG